jgi:hypothetical protein
MAAGPLDGSCRPMALAGLDRDELFVRSDAGSDEARGALLRNGRQLCALIGFDPAVVVRTP